MASSRARTIKSHNHNCFIFICLCAIVFGLYVCFVYGPDQDVTYDPRLRTRSNLNPNIDAPELKRTIMTKLLPQWLGIRPEVVVDDLKSEKPQWDLEHWTPISVTSYGVDPEFSMCKLNFKAYSKGGPNKLPMFKDLLAASQCKGRNSKIMRFSEIKEEMETEEARGLPRSTMLSPTGFVFHESRVGSTLVANLLGSDPFNMVFSESTPPASVLLHCKGKCSHQDKVAVFRNTLLAMGRSPTHKRVFFKFQSITTQHMKIALEAFPETPWVFVHRNPVQTMMSHMDPAKGGGSSANCLKSKRSPSEKFISSLTNVGLSVPNAPNEAVCAAHLNMLCESAVDAYKEFGYYGNDPSRPRGLLLDYKLLPGAVPNLLLELFGQPPASAQLLKSMAKESSQYSKSSSRNVHRGKTGLFNGDSEDKEKRATDAIDEWANKILGPTYEKMTSLSLPVIRSLSGGRIDDAEIKQIAGSDGAAQESSVVLPSYAYEAFRNSHNSSRYEAIDCPDFPADNYPITYDMKRLLDNWNPDVADIPPMHFNSICRFDYQTELNKALNYRNAEKPFVVYNVPEVDEVVKKWSDLDYLNNLVGPHTNYHAETSNDNHFMYWRKKSKKLMDRLHFKPPTGKVPISFADWLKVAVVNNNKTLVDREHLYFRITADKKDHYMFKELPFFYPKESLFIVEPDKQRGIHCRFGMKSVIAENHYDGSRNYVASLGGMRRFILNHPDQCKDLYLYPLDHPSGRHSEVDWSKPDYEKFPRFATSQANEIITTPGDVLYLPTFWFHYIISLNVNFQCNTRSGKTDENKKVLKECGF